ncbi:glycosyltransferase [Methylobacterium sp. P31]
MRAAVAHARRQRIDMLSLGPAQVLGSWAERLVMPCGFFLIAASQDIGRLNAPERPEASANGQFLLFRIGAYCEIGGHAAVRAEICEDAALARRTKRHGLRFALLGAERLIRVRMYRDARALWSGLSKNVSELGGGPAGTVSIAAAGLALTITIPACAEFTLAAWLHHPSVVTALATGISVTGFLALLGLHAAGARHFRIPFGYAFLFPVGYAACLLLALNGARVVQYGGASWKGRRYPASRPSDTVAAGSISRGSAAERTHA